jgi:hypothetical protein
MNKEITNITVALLKKLDHDALASCLYAACDLALRASRGEIPPPAKDMTADQLVRQIITELPPKAPADAEPTKT